MRLAFITIILALFVAPLAAQTPAVVKIGEAVVFAADHDGVDTDGYKLYVNGAAVATVGMIARTSAGVVEISHAFTQRGTYVVEMSAFNVDSDSKSDPLTADVKSITTKPTGLRIIIKVE